MEAYFLFHRGAEMAAVAEEQREDIGSPSDSESPSTSMDSAGSSSELDDDATSSSSSSSSSSSGSGRRRRFEMSSLMAQLPIKRGLSRFFDGKSQSFASLAMVGSLKDLAKPPPRKRLKPSRSCGGGLDGHRGRLLSPRRRCPKAKKSAARSAALSVLGAAQRRPPMAVPARPEGVAGKVLVVS